MADRTPTSAEDMGDLPERLARLGERHLTWPELCRLAGVEHEVADRLWRALGFPDVPPDEHAYTDDDVRALEIAAQGLDRLSGAEREAAIDQLVRETRTVSAYLTRLSEVEIDSLLELQRLSLRERAIADAFDRGLDRSDLGWILFYVLRRRLDDTLRRRGATEPGGEPVLAVGFVDMVDFTRTSGNLEAEEFGRLLNDFESLVWDTVTEAGGQVVKLIGDEAMLVCPSAREAASAALDVIAECERRRLPASRGGLAIGPMLVRGGDYFGPAVNLASRLVDGARPGAVAVDRTFRDALDSGRDFELRERGPVALKGIGRVPVWELSTGGE